MPHSCEIEITDVVTEKMEELGMTSSIRKRLLKLMLICEKNPLTPLYFKSEKSVKKEKIRQLHLGYQNVIHPLSQFQQRFEYLFLLFLLVVLVVKPLDSCVKVELMHPYHRYCFLTVDSLTMIQIIIIFRTGYTNIKTKYIELDPWKIAKNYMTGVFFFSDLLGCQGMLVLIFNNLIPETIVGYINIFILVRAIRIWTVVNLIFRVFTYSKITSKGIMFTTSFIVTFMFILHFFTCLLLSSKLIIRSNFNHPDPHNTSSILVYDVYFDYLFRTTAYILGSTLPDKYFDNLYYIEDYVTVICMYTIGKILIISIWIILAMAILTTKVTTVKYNEIMNELHEYMTHKKLPQELRNKIESYYMFKYHGKYFREDLINTLVSDSLHKEINFVMCQSLIAKVHIFAELDEEQIAEIVRLLKLEIYSPNDTIIQAGTVGDEMYFLASGTVAVYTRSGKEVCHMTDGSFFGEISLVMKDHLRHSTIFAIEFCRTYRLKRSDFQRTLGKHKRIYRKIIETAERRLKMILLLEKSHKKHLFQQAYADPNRLSGITLDSNQYLIKKSSTAKPRSRSTSRQSDRSRSTYLTSSQSEARRIFKEYID